MDYAFPVSPGKKLSLSELDPGYCAGLEKEQALSEIAKLGEELEDLQELHFAAATRSILIVIQGRDTAGKDGSIKTLLRYNNVQSTSVVPFKVPTAEELSHDYLWRIHKHTPPKGGVTIFNRSHYEDVLVVRVHDIVPKSVWSKRYDHIADFERLLADNGTTILKFMLHISKDEQEERLLAREEDPTKSWKLNPGDWKEREYWDAYTEAYEEALEKTSKDHAPWLVIPSNKKWFRDLAILDMIVKTLRPFKEEWNAKLEKTANEMKAELAEYRATIGK